MPKQDLLPYEHVFQYETELFIPDIHTYENRVVDWFNKRIESIEGNTGATVKLTVCPSGFHMDLSPAHSNDVLISFRMNHVHALQIKQICEYYLECYEKHATTDDVTIYPRSSSLTACSSKNYVIIKDK